MTRKIFVSYIERDEKYKQKLGKWKSKKKFGEHHVLITSTDDSDIRRENGKIIRSSVVRKIREADFVIIIIGDDNSNHPWIQFEGLAKRFGIKRYYMRIPYTKAPLPKRMQKLQQIAYNPNAIDKLLRDMSDVVEQ